MASHLPTVLRMFQTLEYYHFAVYFEANDNCNNLNFAFGSTVLGVTAKATRQFDIKISQISCK